MTIVIPTWLIWTLGISLGVPLILAVILSTIIGFGFIVDAFRGRGWWG